MEIISKVDVIQALIDLRIPSGMKAISEKVRETKPHSNVNTLRTHVTRLVEQGVIIRHRTNGTRYIYELNSFSTDLRYITLVEVLKTERPQVTRIE